MCFHFRSEMSQLPLPEEQCALFDSLQPDEDDIHTFCYRYAVSQDWHRAWQKHLGKAEGKAPGQTQQPGRVRMTSQIEGNVWLPGYLWAKVLELYGLASDHELDRRYVPDPEWEPSPENGGELRKFSFCLFSPFMHQLKPKSKCLCVEEDVGYVECQLRHILDVPRHANSRLWIAPNTESQTATNGKYTPLFDRAEELRYVYGLEPNIYYILALEVQNNDGSWPTGLLQQPQGSLIEYAHVTQGHCPSQDLASDSLTGLEASVLNAAISKTQDIVSEVKRKTEAREKEIAHLQQKLASIVLENENFSNLLNARSAEIEKKQNEIARRETLLEQKENRLRKEKEKFRNELDYVENLNTIQSEVIQLNVGGQRFTTSVSTLTCVPDSMLGVMFSGRHSLNTGPDGCVFIDRDGEFFPYILSYLRSGLPERSQVPRDIEVLQRLAEEADFYQLPELKGFYSKSAGMLNSGDFQCDIHGGGDEDTLFGSIFCDCTFYWWFEKWKSPHCSSQLNVKSGNYNPRCNKVERWCTGFTLSVHLSILNGVRSVSSAILVGSM